MMLDFGNRVQRRVLDDEFFAARQACISEDDRMARLGTSQVKKGGKDFALSINRLLENTKEGLTIMNSCENVLFRKIKKKALNNERNSLGQSVNVEDLVNHVSKENLETIKIDERP
jgi:hypothetical protein